METIEKRRSQRKLTVLNASLSTDFRTGINSSEVQTLNLSKRGALIEASVPIFESEDCTFSLTANDGQHADIQGRIVWSTKVADGINRAGVAFRNLTADEEYLLELQLVRSA